MEATEPMTIEQAAEGLLAPTEPEQQEDVAQVEDVAEEVTDAEEVTEEEVEVEAEDETAEGEADLDDTEQDDEDTEEEAQEQPDTFTVKADGEEIEVTLEELTQSFSGQKHIQKGMQEAAEARKQAEQVFTALQQQQAQLAQLYQTMQQTGVVQAPVEPVFDPQDPIGYVEKLGQFNAQKAEFDAQQSQLSQVNEQQSQAQQQAMQAYVHEQQTILQREIPDLADAEKGKQVMSDLRATGEQYGFTAEELSGITDARTVKVLHDAMQFRKLKAGKAKVEQKVKKVRPVTKPKAPRKINQAAKNEAVLRKQLKQTGSVDAAVQLLMGN